MPGFDERALTWDEEPRRVALARAVADAIHHQVPLSSSWKSLEYGAGTGLVGLFLKPYLGSLLLTDSSAGMVMAAEKKIRSMNLKEVAVRELDLSKSLIHDSFDFVFSSMALHHIPDTALILGQFFQIMNRGGTLALVDLVSEDGSFHGADFDGHFGFDLECLKNLASEAGFKECRTEIIYRMTKKDSEGKEKNYPIFLLIGKKD